MQKRWDSVHAPGMWFMPQESRHDYRAPGQHASRPATSGGRRRGSRCGGGMSCREDPSCTATFLASCSTRRSPPHSQKVSCASTSEESGSKSCTLGRSPLALALASTSTAGVLAPQPILTEGCAYRLGLGSREGGLGGSRGQWIEGVTRWGQRQQAVYCLGDAVPGTGTVDRLA